MTVYIEAPTFGALANNRPRVPHVSQCWSRLNRLSTTKRRRKWLFDLKSLGPHADKTVSQDLAWATPASMLPSGGISLSEFPLPVSISTRTFITLRALLQLFQVRLSQFNGASHARTGVAIWQTRAGPTSIGNREVNARCLRTSRNIVNNNSA